MLVRSMTEKLFIEMIKTQHHQVDKLQKNTK